MTKLTILGNPKAQEEEFSELIKNIKYGMKQIKCGKWDKVKYFNYMAEFFDYINLPNDAEEHRMLAKTWEVENK